MSNENVRINNNEPENLVLKNIKKYKKENIESKLSDNENELNNKKAPIKVCNYIVYIFFQKRIGNKEACIFYDYDSCCHWFWLKIKKPQIYGSFFINLFFQLIFAGFRLILSNNLEKIYSFSKNLKFFISFIIALFFIKRYAFRREMG